MSHDRGVRRLLMLIYDFPPATGVGILRPLKLATYLPQSGWEPVVVTAPQAPGAGADPGLANRIQSDGHYDYEYDQEGNTTARIDLATGHTFQYTYDHRNRLTRVQEKDITDRVLSDVQYIYDLMNRRIGRID